MGKNFDPGTIQLFIDQIDQVGGGGGSGTFERFLNRIADLTALGVIDQTSHAPARVIWSESGWSSDPRDPQIRRRLLDNVTRQTGIRFTETTRDSTVFVVREETSNAAPATSQATRGRP